MLVAHLAIAAMIADWTLGMSRHAALVMAALLVLLAPLLGGMRGVTATALVQFVLALVAFVVVGVWMSAVMAGWSLPVVGYATAVMAAPQRPPPIGGRVARHLERCRSDAVDRPWGRQLSGLADPLRNRASSASARSSIAWALLLVAIF